MPIIRARHSFEEQFTTIPNAWVRDSRLSLKAKGLLAQLMSHSPGWSVTIRSLADANGCGRDLVAGAIAELERYGYLSRRQERNDAGQFSETVWETSEPPEVRRSENPSPGNPAPDNPAYKKTINTEDKYKEHPQAELEGVFEEFWKLYPRKVEKIDARKAFDKAYGEYGDEVLEGVLRLSLDRNLPPLQFIPYPASWLRAGGWTNEPYPPREKSKEELASEAAEKSRRDRERDRLHSDRVRREAEEARRAATPAPKCEHDLPLWKCDPCTKRLADSAADE